MQTFLPYGSDFAASARVLDRQRLLKQRVETLQIMNVLAGNTKGWTRHPAVLQWSGHEKVLLEYQEAVCAETVARDFTDTCLDKTAAIYKEMTGPDAGRPEWLDVDGLAITHRASLFRKLPDHYADFAQDNEVYRDYVCCERCNYWWPTHVQ